MTSPPAPAPRSPRALLLVGGLAAAGVAGNFLHFEIFFSIQFLFGSVFSLLALQLLGLGPGVLVAALASSATYVLWNHPYAIIIMTLEVLVVGLLVRRREIELVLADALYWLVLGVPLVYLFYHVVMGLSVSNASITALKQALNGISNALIARLLFLAVQPRFGRDAPSLREFVFNLLAVFVLGPALLLLIVQSRSEFAETDRAAREALRLGSDRTAASVESFLRHRSNDIVRLAAVASSRPAASVQRSIDDVMTAAGDFLRIGYLDRRGDMVAFASREGEAPPEGEVVNYADRPYVPVLEKTLRPMFSEVVLARIGDPEPIVTALAPVVDDGAYAGYIGGVLGLEGLEALLVRNTRDPSLPGLLYSLVDRNGRIIVTNRPGAGTMAPFVEEAGERVPLGRGIAELVPGSRRNVSVSERWKRSIYLADRRIGPTAEWRLVLEQPVAPFQTRLYDAYAEKMALILAILLTALPLAALLSRRVVVSLRRLDAVTADVPGRIQSGQSVHWPKSNIRETQHLIDNFKDVTEALTLDFREIQRVNEELRLALDEVKTLRGILPICSHCKKIRNDAGAWERMEAYVGRHSEAQFSHGLCPDCLAERYPEFATGSGDHDTLDD